MGVLGLACIFSTLVAIDGPLLQKATHVVYAPIENESVALNVSVLPELPRYLFSGWTPGNMTGVPGYRASYMWNRTIPAPNNGSVPNDINVLSSQMLDGVQGPWLRDDPLTGGIRGCAAGTQCNLTVRAPALTATACTSYQIPVNYNQHAKDTLITRPAPATPLNRAGFIADINLVVDGQREAINFVTGNARTDKCAGIFNYTACTLEAAVADYQIQVIGDTVTTLNARDPTIVAVSNNSNPIRVWNNEEGWYNSTLAGIVLMANTRWSGAAYYANGPHDYGPVYYTYGGNTMNFLISYTNDTVLADDPATGKECVSFMDPRDTVIEDMNRLMFYTGYLLGTRTAGKYSDWVKQQIDPGLKINTPVVGHVIGHRNVYHTDLKWFGAAAAIELICIALVFPTFIGWWKLGRPVSFSPIEIAKAFEAPLLSDCNSNSTGRDIATRFGGIRLRYGSTIGVHTGKRKLAFADPTNVQHSQQGSSFEM